MGQKKLLAKQLFHKWNPLNTKRDAIMLLFLVTRPLPRDGGVVGDNATPEAGQFPKVWTRGRGDR